MEIGSGEWRVESGELGVRSRKRAAVFLRLLFLDNTGFGSGDLSFSSGRVLIN